MDIQKLIQIAEDLNLQDKVRELKFYSEKLCSSDKELILPLVGEFSSGKTTLINSLLDNPSLETASRATTASIFEVHFGAEKCYAEIIDENGNIDCKENVGEIKNSELGQVDVVKVYDTSTRIGSSTILVDTPGLSSNDPAHRIALSSYLPNADAILLLTDVNQQLTRSLIDFMKTSQLANKPIFVVITKCDTKTPNEVSAAKAYIQNSLEFSCSNIVTVSATKGNMSEFDSLMADIHKSKNDIVEKSVKERVKRVANEISVVVKDLLKQGISTSEIDNAIKDEEKRIERLKSNIDSLIKDVENRIEDKSNFAISQFSKTVFTQVDGIVKNEGRNCSNSVNSAVNSIAGMILQRFQKDVMSDILSLAYKRQNKIDGVPMGILETINIAEHTFNGFSHYVDLYSVGHEHDKKIGYGVLGTIALAATVVTFGGATGVAGTAVATGTTSTGQIIAADVITDTAAVAYTTKKMNKMAKVSQKVEQAKQFVDVVNKNMESAQQYNQEVGRRVGINTGILETSVGWVTDFFAKPARQRAVNNYIEGTLIPEFRQQILLVSNNMLKEISSLLHQEANNNSESFRVNLQALKTSLKEKKEIYTQKMEVYKQYATILNEF